MKKPHEVAPYNYGYAFVRSSAPVWSVRVVRPSKGCAVQILFAVDTDKHTEMLRLSALFAERFPVAEGFHIDIIEYLTSTRRMDALSHRGSEYGV